MSYSIKIERRGHCVAKASEKSPAAIETPDYRSFQTVYDETISLVALSDRGSVGHHLVQFGSQ
jgi:hypothetical protein